MAKLVLIKTFLYRHEAEIAKGLLKEKNIESVISADDAGGVIPMASLGLGNVKLLVQEQDRGTAAEALQVLDTNVDNTLWEEDVTINTKPARETIEANSGDWITKNRENLLYIIYILFIFPILISPWFLLPVFVLMIIHYYLRKRKGQ